MTYEAMKRATNIEMEQYFTYLPRLAELVTAPYKDREKIVLKFYTTLWVARDRSEFRFLYRGLL